MDQKALHDLAIAYAQARLTRKQYDAKLSPSEDELYHFVYDYLFATEHINEQIKQYPTR